MKPDYKILEEAIETLTKHFANTGKVFFIATAVQENDVIVGNFSSVNAEYQDYTHSLFEWARIMNEDAIEQLNLKDQ